jgi:outer membrane protein TolC
MRRRRAGQWLTAFVLAGSILRGSLGLRESRAEDPPPPPPPPTGADAAIPAPDSVLPLPGLGEHTAHVEHLPMAPQPLPGPASNGLVPGGMDAAMPKGMPINLATAMQLSGATPLDIAAAIAQVERALAQQLQAKVLWVPNANGGVDYFRHDGVAQNLFKGTNFQLGRQTFMVGGGPSLWVGLTDAIYQPLAARQVVNARKADLQAARNNALYDVAQSFFNVQAARGRLAGTGASVTRAEMLVDFATALAPSLIAPLEINRAKAELQSLRQTQQAAIRDWRVASAKLAEILLLDPATLFEPIEPPFLQVTFISPDNSAADLMPVALNNRPEIASQRDQLIAAEQILRQEKHRPFLPQLVVISPATTTGLLPFGNFSAGAENKLNSNGQRGDIEVAAVWQLQNAGLGNIGRIRQSRAERDLQSIAVTRTLFQVRSELTQAVARLQTARVRVVENQEQVIQAIESADKNFIGLRETARPQGQLLRLIVRPQEVVAAIIELNTAYEQYSDAVSEYNTAQFEVYRALGQPAQWVTCQNGGGPVQYRAAATRPAAGSAVAARPAATPSRGGPMPGRSRYDNALQPASRPSPARR